MTYTWVWICSDASHMRVICVSYACRMRHTHLKGGGVCDFSVPSAPSSWTPTWGGATHRWGVRRIRGDSSEETPHPLQRAHASLRAPSFEREGPHPPQEKKGGKNTCGGMYIWEASGSVAYGEISDLIWIDSKRKTPPYSHRPHRRFSVLASRVWRRGRHAAARR